MNVYDETITIINKLDGEDSESGKTEVFKTVITDCGWYSESIADVSGSNISLGQKGKVLIPFSKGYLPYNEWKDEQEGFTARTTDYVFKGEISDNVTASNLSSIYNKYKPNAIKVKYVEELKERTGVPIKVQLRIEG